MVRPSSSDLTRRTLGREASRALLRLINGVDWMTRDHSAVVDQTPFQVVFRRDKLSLRRYPPLEQQQTAGGPRVALPVVLIPPLMVRPFIFDLTPHRSYVRTLLGRGFDVYLVDFGEPDQGDRHLTLDTYVLDWLPAVVEAACRESGSDGVSLLGYCMGGLFALMHPAVTPDPRVRNIVTIGAPVDSNKMGLLTWAVRLAHDQVEDLTRWLGNVPGDLSSAAFKLSDPIKSVTRYARLLSNLWNDEYVEDFEALSQWTDNFTDYPGKAFRQLVNEFLVGNKLKQGKMEFGGKLADLHNIRCPLLAFAGDSDNIVPVSSVRKVLDLVSSQDKQLNVVSGGHMGMFGGRRAPDQVWQVSADWLAARS